MILLCCNNDGCRGVAERDPTQPHGLRLLIEDYPYANDGLLMWFALENLVRTYVNYYIEMGTWLSQTMNCKHGIVR